MADEAIVAVGTTTATLTPLVEIRYNGIHELTSAEVIQKINEYVSHNKQIDLFLCFGGDEDEENYQLFRFNATGAMQNTIVENSSHIKKIAIRNYCKEKDEHDKYFTFCTKIVRGIIGKGKHLSYSSFSYEFEFELEQANQLAQALRSNNNNNDAIESFNFRVGNLTPVTFQTLLDALLDSGVRKLVFWSDNNDMFRDINYRNINVDFTRMETNISLKELDLSNFYMREEDFRSLFHSIKKNKGVEKLTLSYWNTYKKLPEEMKKLFEEMMRENITLLDCILHVFRRQQDGIFELIHFYMKVNRMWKRYMMQREREKKTRTVITRIEEGDNTNNNNNEEEEEEERKKRLKMRLLLHLFMNKPVMRDTILFHLLREYPDDLGLLTNDDTQQQQQSPLLLRMIKSNVTKNKRKRTTDDDGDNDSNDGTDDPDDNDNDNDNDNESDSDDSDDSNDDSDSGDSESDDGTDGTL